MTNSLDKNIDHKHIWHPFDAIDTPENLFITHAQGIYLHTDDGRKIIDAIGSWWVNLHGHCHPTLVAALKEQANQLEHVIFSGFTHQPAIDFTREFLKATQYPYDKIFFSDNGSTATEVAIKMAFQYWYNQGKARTKLLAFEGAYHGDTFGAMAAGDRSSFNKPFFPFLFEVTFIPLPSDETIEMLLSKLETQFATEEFAGFIFEPLIQGAAGMRIYKAKHLERIIQLCQKYQVITIADEVFTGFYRTGKLLATEHMHTAPDIVCLSKGITGGFMPLGATVCKEYIYSAFASTDVYKTFFHGHSYTGNPLALALAYASLKLLLEHNTQIQIQKISTLQANFSAQLLQKHKHIRCNSLGTILSIEIISSDQGYFSNLKETIYHHFLSRGILLRPLGNILYFLPMYCFTETEIRSVHASIDSFLGELPQ